MDERGRSGRRAREPAAPAPRGPRRQRRRRPARPSRRIPPSRRTSPWGSSPRRPPRDGSPRRRRNADDPRARPQREQTRPRTCDASPRRLRGSCGSRRASSGETARRARRRRRGARASRSYADTTAWSIAGGSRANTPRSKNVSSRPSSFVPCAIQSPPGARCLSDERFAVAQAHALEPVPRLAGMRRAARARRRRDRAAAVRPTSRPCARLRSRRIRLLAHDRAFLELKEVALAPDLVAGLSLQLDRQPGRELLDVPAQQRARARATTRAAERRSLPARSA